MIREIGLVQWSQTAWLKILYPSLTRCAILGKLPNLSVRRLLLKFMHRQWLRNRVTSECSEYFLFAPPDPPPPCFCSLVGWPTRGQQWALCPLAFCPVGLTGGTCQESGGWGRRRVRLGCLYFLLPPHQVAMVVCHPLLSGYLWPPPGAAAGRSGVV